MGVMEMGSLATLPVLILCKHRASILCCRTVHTQVAASFDWASWLAGCTSGERADCNERERALAFGSTCP